MRCAVGDQRVPLRGGDYCGQDIDAMGAKVLQQFGPGFGDELDFQDLVTGNRAGDVDRKALFFPGGGDAGQPVRHGLNAHAQSGRVQS